MIKRCDECIYRILVKELDPSKLVGSSKTAVMPEIMCRRFPPTVTPTFDKNGRYLSSISQMPMVTPDHWCGEFVTLGESRRESEL